jgi:hypothetical protein
MRKLGTYEKEKGIFVFRTPVEKLGIQNTDGFM